MQIFPPCTGSRVISIDATLEKSGTASLKRLKHNRPEDVYYSRKEFHILDKISGGPGIVKLLDYYEAPEQSFIITEFLEGGTPFKTLYNSKNAGGDLFQKISNKSYILSEHVVRILMKQVYQQLLFSSLTFLL